MVAVSAEVVVERVEGVADYHTRGAVHDRIEPSFPAVAPRVTDSHREHAIGARLRHGIISLHGTVAAEVATVTEARELGVALGSLHAHAMVAAAVGAPGPSIRTGGDAIITWYLQQEVSGHCVVRLVGQLELRCIACEHLFYVRVVCRGLLL